MGRIDISAFNCFAKDAIGWTRRNLPQEDMKYLDSLPLVARLEDVEIVHGTLYAPELFDYLQTSYDASLSMELMEKPVCFVGHSHVPIAFIREQVISYSLSKDIRIPKDGRVIVNVGSVGQPRDKDPRAAFATYDSDEGVVHLRRCRYDIDAAATKIRQAGLPSALGERLRHGR